MDAPKTKNPHRAGRNQCLWFAVLPPASMTLPALLMSPAVFSVLLICVAPSMVTTPTRLILSDTKRALFGVISSTEPPTLTVTVPAGKSMV